MNLSLLSIAVGTAIAGLSLAHGSAAAATIEVSSNLDDGTGCTLREALVSANETEDQGNGCSEGSESDIDTITFSNSLPSNTITLSQADTPLIIDTRKNVKIDGATIENGITIDGNNLSRVLEVGYAAEVSIHNLTITGGSISTLGGGVFMGGDSLHIENTSISGNHANSGGAIFISRGIVNIANSTISGNSAVFGAGISMRTSSLTMKNSTLSGNSVSSGGGGINADFDAYIDVNNSTFSDNTADYGGGGVYLRADSTFSMSNSIMANSTGGADCVALAGATRDISDSLIETGGCPRLLFGDPDLLPLADNGGATKTQALRTNSQVRDRGRLSTCETTDQRGQVRDDGDGKCDMGAIEFNPRDDKDGLIVIPLGSRKAVIVPN